MIVMGNVFVNSVWEGVLGGYFKLGFDVCREEKECWIWVKYEQKFFLVLLLSLDVLLGQQLFWVVVEDDLWLLVMFLVYGFKEEVNEIYGDGDGWIVLYFFSVMVNVVFIQLFIWYGVDVRSWDVWGLILLVYVCWVGSQECVDILIQYGCFGEGCGLVFIFNREFVNGINFFVEFYCSFSFL